MTVNEVVVNTPIASAMGAKVTIANPDRGMFLVIGRDSSPEPIVRASGGKVVLRLNGGKILATLPFVAYLSLLNNYKIACIGPVTVDIDRLSKISKMLVKKAGNS
jgi:hypothetical protein